MTPKKEKALAALLSCQTKGEAARQAGISHRTLNTYFSDPDFREAYKAAFGNLVEEASHKAQQSLHPALDALRSIMQDEDQNGQIRVSAARSLLEYSLKLSERADILDRLDELEKSLGGTYAKH